MALSGGRVYQNLQKSPSDLAACTIVTTMLFEITFGDDPSLNHRLAVEQASEHPSYRRSGHGLESRHEIRCSQREVEFVFLLLSLCAGWQTTSVKVDGRPRPPRMVQAMAGCALDALPLCDRRWYQDFCGYCVLRERRVRRSGRQLSRTPTILFGRETDPAKEIESAPQLLHPPHPG